MKRCPPVARIVRRLGGLLGLVMVGCMPLGYAYPKVSYIPPGTVGPAPRKEVRAFRVDITDDDNSLDFTEKDSYVLSRLPLHSDGSYDPQTKVAVDYGFLLFGMADVIDAARHHTILVRLYRPGYHTVEIEPWKTNERIQWVEAPKVIEQEQAIDDLVSTWKTTPERLQNKAAYEGFVPPRDPIVFRYLAPGSTSEEHRHALLFAAAEYSRLLPDASDDPETKARLQAKATALREMAAK
jgi:hypothetical protein